MSKIGDFLFGDWGTGKSVSKLNVIMEKVDNRSHRDKKLVEKVLTMVREKPERFSATWWGSKSVSRIMSNSSNTVSIWEDGEIMRPFKPEMLNSEKKELEKMIRPLYERDMDNLLEKL